MPGGKLKLGVVLFSTTVWLWANRPPTFSGIVTDTLAYEDRYWSTWLEASDPDDDPLTFRLLPGAPAGINLNASSGFLNWTPTNVDVGVYELVAEVSDGNLTDFLPFKLYVFNTNDAPYWTLTPPAEALVNEDSLYTFTLHAEDDDARHGDAIHYILKLAPTGATIDTLTGTIHWIPHNGQVRSHTFSVWAQDDSAATIQTTWSVTVNNTPVVFLNAPPTEATEDATYSFDLESNDERQGNTAYSFINGAQPTWLTINSLTGQLSGKPINNQVGNYPVQIRVDDGNGSQAVLNFTLTVTNTKPTITTTVLPSASENSPYTADINADDEGLGNTIYRFISYEHPLPSWLSINSGTGVITGVPDNSHVGFYPFEVEFDDGNGGKDTASFYLEVQNTPPQLFYPDLTTVVVEDTPYEFDFNSSDDGKGSVLYRSISLPAWLTLNPLNGILNGTPRNEHVGVNTIKIYVSDGHPNGNDTLEYQLTVINRPPQLLSSPITSVTEDQLYTYDVNTDDENHGATYSLSTPISGSDLTIEPTTGIITGTFPNNLVGSQIVGVIIDDGNQGIILHEFNLEVTNTPPRFTAVGDQVVNEDSPFHLDIQTDDEEIPFVNYSLKNAPAGMTINASTGVIQWTPDNSQVATYTPKVLATDNHGGTDSLTFQLQVSNVAPQITSTPYTRAREDSLYWYDLESTDEGVGNTAYALLTPVDWLTLDPHTGILQGTPSDLDIGTYNVSVRVDDGNGGTAIQSWTITVNNLVPVITTEALVAAREDALYTATLAAYPSSEGRYTWSLQGSKPAWLNIDPVNGVLSGTPSNSAVGRQQITVRVTDINGAYSEKQFNIDVTNINPVFLTTGKIYASEDNPLVYNLNTDDEGDEGPGVQGYTLITYPTGWLSCDPSTGVLSGTPRDADVSTFPLVVRYQDGNGGLVELTTEIVVSNTPPQFTSLNPTTNGVEDQFYSYQFTSDDDPWGRVRYNSISALPSGLDLSITGLLSGYPSNAAVGVHTINIIASDGNGGKDTLGFQLQISNAAPNFLGLAVTPSPYTQVGDSIFVYEDLPYQLNFNSDDELDGTNALYTVQSCPAWLNLTDAAQGILSGTPTNVHVGVSPLNITFNDGNGGSYSRTYQIKVINVPGQFTNDLTTTTAIEDQAYQLDLNSTDEGQGAITYSILSGNPGWLQIDAGTGLITSLPNRPANEDVTAGTPVTFVVTDGNEGRDTITIIFVVQNVNDPPVWVSAPSGTVATTEDALYTTTLSATNPDFGDQLSYSLVTKPSGMTIDPTTGIITWTPDNSLVGNHNITAKVADLSGTSITRSWTIQVQNNPSTINPLSTSDFSPAFAVSAIGDTFYIHEDTTYIINFSSADEGSTPDSRYSFDEFPNPNWISLTNAQNGTVRLSPTNLSVGLHSFKIFFTDQPGSADTSTIYLRVLNVPPIITTTGPFSATEDQAFVDSIRCSDHGSGNVTYTFLSGQPPWLVLNPTTGILSGTPSNSDVISNGSFTVQVNDGNGGVVTRSFDFTVLNTNDPPVWVSAPSGTVATTEDALYTTTLSATDPDFGDQLSYSLVTKPSGMTIDPNTGIITWTPDNSQVGSHSITARVADLAGTTSSRSWIINVTNSPSPILSLNHSDFSPSSAVIAVADTFYIYEDTLYSINFSAADEKSGITPYYSLNERPNPSWATITDASDGLVRLAPQNQHVGLDSIQIRFYDQPQSANDAIIYLRVLNSPPILLHAGPFTATEDTPFSYDLESTDENSGLCRYSFISGKPSWLSIDSQTGLLSGIPTNEFVGSTQFSIQVEDGNGGSAQQTYTLTVINSNDPPNLAVIRDTTILEDNPWSLNVNATDDDAGDTFTFSLIEAPTGMTINPTTGLISWTPTNAAVGSHLITIKVQDATGATATQSFNVTVQNVLPTFNPILLTYLTEDSYFSYDINCSDENYGTVIYSLLSAPDFISINFATGQISGTPLNKHVGNQTVQIQVNDGSGIVTTSWNFTVLNTPPTITTLPDTTAEEDTPYVYDINSSDDNQGQIRYTSIVVPSWLSLDSLTGILSGTPRNDHVGDTLVAIKVTDGNGGSNTQTFILHIININDPPLITSAPITICNEDSLYRYLITASDPDNDQLTFTLQQAPTGMNIDVHTGLITWTPDNRYSNQKVAVQAKVTDSSGSSALQDWTITVTNTAPRFINPPPKLYATEDQSFIYDFTCDDENLGLGTYTLLQAPGWVQLINPVLGIINGTPVDSHVTVDAPLRLSFTDGNGGSDTLILTITVINKEPVFLTTADTSVYEGVPFSYDLQCDDESTGGVTYQALTPLPPWLTLHDATGLLSGTAKNQDVGLTALNFRAVDSHGGFSDLSFNLAILNAPPDIITSPPNNAVEDSLYTFVCHLADESGVYSYSFSLNPGWLSVNPTTGQVTGTPQNQHVGDNVARLVVRDAYGGADSITFVINVQNSAPLITNTPVTTAQEDLLYSLDINCSDEGQGTIAYTALEKPTWLALNPATGKLSGTPSNKDVTVGTPVRIVVNDGHAGFDTLEFNLQVFNTAPQFTHLFTDTLIIEDDLFIFDFASNDEKDGPTRYRFIGPSLPWLTLDTLTGLLSGIPLNHQVIEATPLQIQVDDGNGGQANTIFFIAVQNRPPRFTKSSSDTVALENTIWSYDFNADDEGQGTTIYSLLAPFPTWVSIDSLTGLLQAVPQNDHVGTHSLTIKFDDRNGSDITHTFNLTVQNVNDAPYFITSQNSDTTAEDHSWSFSVAAQDSDLIHLDTLQFSLTDAPDFLQIEPLTGQISGTPTNADVGVHHFTIIVADKDQASDSLTFTLTVTNVNDSPVWMAQTDTNAYEDQLLKLVLHAVDEDIVYGDSIVYTLIQSPTSAFLNGDTILWLPNNNQVGAWEFITRVTDRTGSAQQDTFLVNVVNTNDPPRLFKTINEATVYEDSLWIYQFQAADDDSSFGEKLTFTISNAPSGMNIVDSTGLVTWIPTNENVGIDSFMVTVTDREKFSDQLLFYLTILNTNDPPQIVALHDTSAYEDSLFLYTLKFLEVDPEDTTFFSLITGPPGMQLDSLTGLLSWRPTNEQRDQNFMIICRITDLFGAGEQDTFFIHVLNTNDAPVLSALPPLELSEDQPLTLPYSHWFSYADDVDNVDSSLVWDFLNFTHLTIDLLPDSVRFIPPVDYFGLDTGLVVISDGALSDSAILTVSILPVNDPPIISSDFPTKITLSEDNSASIALNKYVSDVDNDTSELYWYVEPYLGQRKIAPLVSPRVKSVLKKGTDEIISSAHHSSPVGGNQIRTTLVVSSGDGDSIQISIDPITHVATINARPNFNIDSINFHFIVTDTSRIAPQGKDSAIVCIEITPVNDPPLLSSIPPITIKEDSVLQIALSDWFHLVSDVDNPDSTLIWIVLHSRHFRSEQTAGMLILTPDPNWYGTDTLTVIVSDGELRDTSAWLLTCSAVNDPPTFSAIADTSFLEDDTLRIDLKPYLYDVETPLAGLHLSATALSGHSSNNGEALPTTISSKRTKPIFSTMQLRPQDSVTIEIDPTTLIATIYGTPNYFTPPLPFKLTVYDDSLAQDSIIWHIGINPVNDPPVIGSLSPLGCPEDSSIVINIVDWYPYVNDPETPDDRLLWSFSSDTCLILNYDTTHKKLNISSRRDWFGNREISVVVIDADSATETTKFNFFVTPRNDPPVIDTCLAHQRIFQTDTLKLQLFDYVHDVDHSFDSLSLTLRPGKHVHFQHDLNFQTLKLWCGYEWFGQDTLLLTVSDPAGATDSLDLFITVVDTARPRFRFAIYQNQLTSKLITIEAYSDEFLAQAPIITINGDTTEVNIQPDSLPYYRTGFTIDTTQIVKVIVSGEDRAGNRGFHSYSFGVARISVAQGGILSDPDTLMSFIFGPQAVEYDLCVLYLPQPEPDTLFKLAKSSLNGPVSPIIEFVAPVGQLKQPVRVVFNLERLAINQRDAQYLGLYHWENGTWHYLPTYTGLETGVFWAYTNQTGQFQIQLNTAYPVTVLSSEFTLAPNYPNPFNSQTIIRYVIGVVEFHSFNEAVQTLKPLPTTIRIYNLLGQEVKTLVDTSQLPGSYTVIWDGKNNAGQSVASGPYFCVALIGDRVLHRKMLLIK